jgi:TonB family protein
MKLCLHAAVLLFVLLFGNNASAQDPPALAARLHAMAAMSSIDDAGLLPWHLKMDVQLFDAKGKPSQQGTIEEWWASPEMYRVKFAFPSFTRTELHTKDGVFATKGGPFEPGVLDDLLEQVVHPVPHDAAIDSSKLDLRTQTFGGAELDCIMLDQPMKSTGFPPLGLFPTYCLDPAKNTLRAMTSMGSLTYLRSRMGLFQGRSVPLDCVAKAQDEAEVVSGHVSALGSMEPASADFVPGPEMGPAPPDRAAVSEDAMKGLLLAHVDPAYPQDAKDGQIFGPVELRATIGRDGRVRRLQVVTTPSPTLGMSAIAAVRKWSFRPYKVDGVATEVETTITVDFSFALRQW